MRIGGMESTMARRDCFRQTMSFWTNKFLKMLMNVLHVHRWFHVGVLGLENGRPIIFLILKIAMNF